VQYGTHNGKYAIRVKRSLPAARPAGWERSMAIDDNNKPAGDDPFSPAGPRRWKSSAACQAVEGPELSDQGGPLAGFAARSKAMPVQRHQHDPGHPGPADRGTGPHQSPIKNILQLAQGSVVELDALAGEPMDVLVNGCLIAQGEVVVVNDKFGIRLTDMVTPSERCAGSAVVDNAANLCGSGPFHVAHAAAGRPVCGDMAVGPGWCVVCSKKPPAARPGHGPVQPQFRHRCWARWPLARSSGW
jgi:flagellar motor switch protein FliN/FliY